MQKLFHISARGAASVLFRRDECLTVNYSLDGTPIVMMFATRYSERGFAAAVPGEMCLDVIGPAPELKEAASGFTNAGRDIANLISFLFNAFVSYIEPEVVYEVTPGVSERDYFQRLLPPDQVCLCSRFVNVGLATAFIEAHHRHVEKDRLSRAILQYCEALKDWKQGHELLAMSHLFMGAEALKTASWRHYASVNNMRPEDLGLQWGYEQGGRLSLEKYLDDTARVKLVFNDDKDCHRAAKNVSDQFEHGFANAGKLHEPAGKNLIKTAAHLRSAVLSMIDLDEEWRALLQSPKYNTPKGPLGNEHYLWGKLIGVGDNLAAPGTNHPICGLEVVLEEVLFDTETETYETRSKFSATGSFAAGISLVPGPYEIWDRSAFSPTLLSPKRPLSAGESETVIEQDREASPPLISGEGR
ncbi:hypothetical protein M446_1485 [Methylobacterium sp. 4-46]|uniref:hypothetical protein n=1 Tax=unclassified Methylobacterium TaxID=2615210 RepID=UPI000152CF3D|nr:MULTISPECIES: hypothetical protein [Methylobacterium]ACA15990.1 hypothetical protein M446_1485 [Methylobacterium sp. 4-46]WFT81704.1 hypothetical protein QA634_07530 [Methylobacterium nodulans]